MPRTAALTRDVADGSNAAPNRPRSIWPIERIRCPRT
jgi:hypothetical protein